MTENEKQLNLFEVTLNINRKSVNQMQISLIDVMNPHMVMSSRESSEESSRNPV